jgi:glycerol-3-phosphate O-acyltransferase / dihydroxyacetone phosphate acyltransferase
VNLISAAIYRLLQAIVWVTFSIYFRRIIFINRERLNEKGPLLVISNHPNTVMDPLMALYQMPKICNLLANYSLFKNPISNAILSFLYCIPIQRISDVAEGQPLKNEEAFRRCDEHLINNGNIYIAVEGTSYAERHIRELKTGMARIAFSVEAKTNFEINLRILPIVITYFEPLKFRQDVVVEVGELISVDDWRAAYESNPRKSIGDFTDSIEQKMKSMTIDCKNAEEDTFLKKLEALLQSDNYLETYEHYKRSKTLLTQLHNWQQQNAAEYEQFKSSVEIYFEKLKKLNIEDINVENIEKKLPLSISALLVTFPIFLIGFVNNILPAWLSDKMIQWMKIDKAYDTTIRYTCGLMLFPIFWWIQKMLLIKLLNYAFNGWFYAFTAVFTGLIAYWHYKNTAILLDYWIFKKEYNYPELKKMRQIAVTRLNKINSI